MGELIDRIHQSFGRDAERARARLESAYLPNQVLMPGAAQLVADLFTGLDGATPDGVDRQEGVSFRPALTAGGAALDSAVAVGLRPR